ncbi:helix-turn-helix transcriptional regulator [Thiocystis minor]|uniref:helix-turn-helix transcriptional regulator n=1 Tax=Thiocystis minor TaxID=61597 RepID=UPI001911A9EA|nr:WYL domain-containing protein [Thiocystis minor]
MNDFLRRLTILSLIPRRPDWASTAHAARDAASAPRTGKTSAAQLHAQLHQRGFRGNLRAVQRDLVYLGELFPELEHDGQRAGGQGWCWRGDAPVRDLPGLDPALALTFAMARELLQPQLPLILLERLQPYFEVADRVLREAGPRGWETWKDRVRVIPEGLELRPAQFDAAVMGVVQTALLEGKRFRGRYQPRGRDLAEYVFNPLGLVFRRRVVYLVATLWDYGDPRHFALHRFAWAEGLEEDATPPEGFVLETYLKTGAFDYVADGSPVLALRLRMTEAAAAHLHETPLAGDQTIADDATAPGWFQVSATVLDSEQLVWWLRGFGDQVEVLEPEPLRQRMLAGARGLAVLYGIS